ncbi:MAG: hypothetical protein AB7E46_12150 [Desulfovibrio sp.]
MAVVAVFVVMAMLVLMSMVMVSVLAAHKAFTTLAAAHAAP